MMTSQENTMRDKIEEIYKWHNALVLEDSLNQSIQGDFKFTPSDGGYRFVDGSEKEVLLNDSGELISSHIQIEQDFIEESSNRIQRTNKMLKMLS